MAVALLVLAAALAVSAIGCRSKPAPEPRANAPLPLPAAPENLVLRFVAPRPAALYARLRAFADDAGPRLPASPELAAAELLGLPLAVSSALDGTRPLAGGIVVAPGGEAGVVLACPVQSGAELVSALSLGAKPARLGARDPKTGLTLLTGGAGPPLGVIDDWVVVASDPAVIRSAGPYVARVLAAAPPAAEALRLDVDARALHGPLGSVLRARWASARTKLAALARQMEAREGRPADWADPATILAAVDRGVEALVALLSSSDHVALSLELATERAELVLEVTPTPGGQAERDTRALETGSLDPLLTLPRGVLASVLTRLPHTIDEAALPSVVEALASRLPASDARALEASLGLVARGFAGTVALGVLPDETLVARGEVSDPVALEQAEPSLLAALARPGLREPLRAAFGPFDLGASRTKLASLDTPVHRLELVRRRDAGAHEALWWTLRGDAWLGALGTRPGPALDELGSGPSLAADAGLRAMVARRAAVEPSFSLFADLGGLAAHPGAPARVLYAFGRHARTARAELELSRGAVDVLCSRWWGS